jgi:hypothetical protein
MTLLGQWNPQTDVEIEDIKHDLTTMRKSLLDYLFQRGKLEHVRGMIRKGEDELTDRVMRRYVLSNNSAETIATMAKQRFMIGMVCFTDDDELYWPTRKAFNDEPDSGLVERLIRLVFESTVVPITETRELARSFPWRGIWSAAGESAETIFGKPGCDWSDSQRDLAHWSCVYSNVYDSMDRPITEVVEDDDLMDSWFLRQADKIEKHAKENLLPKSDTSSAHKPRKAGRQEEFVMADAEGAKRVYAMNDPMARAKIKARQRIIATKGTVKEEHMPDSQAEMRQIAHQQYRDQVKKGK